MDIYKHARITRKLISLPRSALLLTTIMQLPLSSSPFFLSFHFFSIAFLSNFPPFFYSTFTPRLLLFCGCSYGLLFSTVRRHVAPINYQLPGSVHRQPAASTTCSECTFNQRRDDSCRPQIEPEESRLPTARHLSRLIKPEFE